MDTDARFWAKVRQEASGCWTWTGYVDPLGYGRFHVEGEQRAHRWAYRRFVGPLQTGLVIDHLCRNRACVNPEHLRLVSSKDNTHAPLSEAPAKRLRESRTCIRGHPWRPETTGWVKKRWRRCMVCQRERSRYQRALAREIYCPWGHGRKRRTSDGKLYCYMCASDAHKRPSRPIPQAFACGHIIIETGRPDRRGNLYCSICRSARRLRTHCRRGHALTPDNVYIRGRANRTCRTCWRERLASYAV